MSKKTIIALTVFALAVSSVAAQETEKFESCKAKMEKRILEAIEKEAVRRGFVTPRGKPNVEVRTLVHQRDQEPVCAIVGVPEDYRQSRIVARDLAEAVPVRLVEVQIKRLTPKKGPITLEPSTSMTIISDPQVSEVTINKGVDTVGGTLC